MEKKRSVVAMVVGIGYILLLISNFCFADTPEEQTGLEGKKVKSPYHFRDLGDEFSKQNKNTKALEAYKKAISLDAKMFSAHIGAGRMYARLKDYASAIKEFETAIKISPTGSADAIKYLIMIYLFKDDMRVLDYLKMLDDISPEDKEVMLEYVINGRFFGLEEVDSGFDITMSMPKEAPKEIIPYAKKADEFISKGKYVEAINVYKESIAVKDSAEAHVVIGAIYVNKLYRFQEAIMHLKRAIELEPTDKLSRIYLIKAFGLMKNYPKVIEESERLLEMDKLNKFVLFYLGYAYFELKEWDKAVENWRKLQKLDKILLGVIEGEYKEAISLSAPKK